MILSTVIGLALLGQVDLPGAALGLEQAEAKSGIIVVAKAKPTGFYAGSNGMETEVFALTPSEILKGELRPGERERLHIALTHHLPNRLPYPRKNEEYLLFIDGPAGDARGPIKMLPRTPESIEAVKKMIKKARKP